MNYKNKVKLYLNDINKFNQMEIYVNLIEEYNQKMNLTGFSGDKLWEEGIFQSLLLLNNAFNKNDSLNSFNTKQKMLDIGAGAGFPSIPFLIQHINKLELTIYEPMNKRVQFLEMVKEKLNISNLTIKKIRSEDSNQKNFFDFVTARAVTELKNLIEISHHLGKINCQFSFLKSLKIDQEIKDSEWIMKKMNIQNFKIDTINFNDKSNKIISYYKNNSTPKEFPRKWNQIIKDL